MQTTSNIMVVTPNGFRYNEQTALSNSFQNKLSADEKNIQQKVLIEFKNFVTKLKDHGINVIEANDKDLPLKPDAVFPNNWVSFHGDGKVILYPMCAPNRRNERNMRIIENLKNEFTINKIVDLSGYERENLFLEGTGSVVFDHINKLAYACLSPRTHKELLEKLCEEIKYKPIYFTALDEQGLEIYHTNVMMCIAEKFAVVCTHSIKNISEKALVIDSLKRSGHEIIEINFGQVKNFAGNMMALRNKDNKDILAMSQSAFDSLSGDQKSIISKYAEMLPLSVKTIETIGGGSVRCMIAEIFLPER